MTRFDAEEARRILERAAQLHAEDEGRASDVSTSDLAAAAEQAGISSSALVRAMAEVRGLKATPTRERRRTATGVEARLLLNVPISDAELDRVWDVAIRHHGLGDIEAQGNTKVWRPRQGRARVELAVRQGDASTEVCLRGEHLGGALGWWPLAALGIGFAAGVRHPLGLAALLAVLLAGRYLRQAQRRRALSERLERQLDAVEAELAPRLTPSG